MGERVISELAGKVGELVDQAARRMGDEEFKDAERKSAEITARVREKVLQFSMPQRLMAEMRQALQAGDVKEITRIYYEMWPEEKPPNGKP